MRSGYKQSEVGVIPEDWDTHALGDSSSLITKGTTPTSIGRSFSNTGVRFLKAETLSESGVIVPEKLAYIDSATHAVLGRSKLAAGDLLVSIAGVLGRVGMVEEEDLPANTNQALAIVRLGKQSLLDRRYLFHALRGSTVIKQIRDISVQAAQANISLKNVRDFQIPLPPTKAEQEAIAEALSDGDAFMESVGRLLAKKRHLRQGAMQSLLTGRKRLPGYTGEWKPVRLGEVADIRTGGTPSTQRPQYWDGDIPWCTPTDLTALKGGKYLSGTERKISVLGLKASSAQVIPVNAVLMTSRATIGELAINRVPVSTNQGFKSLIPSQAADVEFLYYVLLTHKQALIALSSGSTFLELGKKQLAAFHVLLPSRIEQEAIAAALSDMDTEIAALEEQLAKARKVKQGMMQELLTGGIRLV